MNEEYIIKIKEHNNGRFFCRFRNIICLSNFYIKNKMSFEYLYFYDINQEKIVDINGWSKKLKNHQIFYAYSFGGCVYALTTCFKKNFLICLNMNDKTWKECSIAEEFVEPTENVQSIIMQDDKRSLYLGFYLVSKKKWIYYKVNHNTDKLELEQFLCIEGEILHFNSFCFDVNEFLFLISGSKIKIENKKETLFMQNNHTNLLLFYDSKTVEIIDNSKKNIEYDAKINDFIYYEKNDNEKTLYQYNIKKKEYGIIQLKNNEYTAITENNIFIYNNKIIKRISDQRVIHIADIMNNIKKMGILEYQEIDDFPSLWVFYDNWIEIQLENFSCLLLKIDTMQLFYFDKAIDIDDDQIFVYEYPLFYMQ